jgi:hypothetical protein
VRMKPRENKVLTRVRASISHGLCIRSQPGSRIDAPNNKRIRDQSTPARDFSHDSGAGPSKPIITE